MHLAANVVLAATLFSSMLWGQCELQKLQAPGALVGIAVLDVQGDEALVHFGVELWLCSWTPFGWIQTEKISPSDAPTFGGGEGDLDGNTLAIGSPSWSGGSAVYVFERASPGTPWIETAKLLAPEGAGIQVAETFGSSVALEGNVLVVGAPADILGFVGPGQVSIYERTGSEWSEAAVFAGGGLYPMGTGLGESTDVEAGQVFATKFYGSVFASSGVNIYSKVAGQWKIVQALGLQPKDLHAAGGWLAIATVHYPNNDVLLFQQTAGSWSQVGSLPIPTGGWSPDRVAMDGSLTLVSDFASSGAAFLFEEAAGAWALDASLAPGDLQPGDQFGARVALDGDRILVSSQSDKDLGISHFSTYAFSASGQGCPSLTTGTYMVSSSAGGAQALALDAGPSHAGQVYLLAGSLSGFWPGTVFAGHTIPLNADLYLSYTLFHGGSPPLVGNLGFLNGAGQAVAQVILPPDPLLAGLQAHHAFGVADAAFNLVHISNPVPLLVL
jgi:hypothetical protein